MSNASIKFDKLYNKLRGGDQENFEQVALWEKEFKEASLIDNLGELAAVRLLMKELEREVAVFEEELKWGKPEKLTSDDALAYCLGREITKVKIDKNKWFLGLFSTARKTMEAVEKKLDEELE
jgi:hypothetical protein